MILMESSPHQPAGDFQEARRPARRAAGESNHIAPGIR